jgi:hypothetical protein
MEKEKVKLFQNVAGHISSKRVAGLSCLTIGAVLLIYATIFGIHNKTAVEFNDLISGISIFFYAGTGILGVSVGEYFSKLNPLKK